MAKRNISSAVQVDNDVMLRASAVGALLLGILLMVIHLFLPQLLGVSRFAAAVRVALELLFIWLVITSIIRSIHRIRNRIAAWKLLLAGSLTAVAAPLVRELFLRIVARFSDTTTLEPYNTKVFLFFAGLGLLAASIATIRLRIKNRALGNIMELLLIAVVAFLFFYFTK